MRATVTLTPKLTSDSWGLKRTLNGLLAPGLLAQQRTERSEWEYGLIRSGDLRLKLNDPTGRYEPTGSTGSVFSGAGCEGAMVEVTLPDAAGDPVVVWRGAVTGAESRHLPARGVTELLARSTDSALRDAVLSPGALRAGQSMAQIFAAIAAVARVNAAVSGVTTELAEILPGGVKLGAPALLAAAERAVVPVAEAILQAHDAILTYHPSTNALAAVSRGLSSATPHEIKTVSDIIDIESGTAAVRNRFQIATGFGGADATLRIESESSIARYGLHGVSLDLSWVGSVAQAAVIGGYLLDRLWIPRRKVQLVVEELDLPPSLFHVGANIRLAVPPLVPVQATRVGDVRYRVGEAITKVAPQSRATLTGDFWIEGIRHDLEREELTLTLREGG